jgi:hypothetical protein
VYLYKIRTCGVSIVVNQSEGKVRNTENFKMLYVGN